jgi:hypothetical protein
MPAAQTPTRTPVSLFAPPNEDRGNGVTPVIFFLMKERARRNGKLRASGEGLETRAPGHIPLTEN